MSVLKYFIYYIIIIMNLNSIKLKSERRRQRNLLFHSIEFIYFDFFSQNHLKKKKKRKEKKL